MKFQKLVNEIYDTNINKSYPASNSAPRKDFAPASSKDGYHNPYQDLGSQHMEQPQPDSPISYPFPLQTISDSLATSFVSLVDAISKMDMAKHNLSLNINQKNGIEKISKFSKKILSAIKNVAFKIDEFSDLSVEKTPEIKMNSSENKNPTHLKNQEVVIKLPK